MRTVIKWEEIFQTTAIKTLFPPRIVSDLCHIPFPKFKNEEIESTFIFGAVKSGKTIRAAHLTLQELRYLYLKCLPAPDGVIFVSYPELFAEIKETYNNSNKTEKKVLKKYMECYLLVLDDFLSSKPTDWVMDILYRLINYRYEYMKLTIITSNLSLSEIEEKLGDQRITSRIDRMCKIEEKQSYV
jgi:DNA replication protein DnaC